MGSDSSPGPGPATGPGFPSATEAEWRALAEAGLKGRTLDDLVRRTLDGIAVPPLSSRADWPVPRGDIADPSGMPGLPPFTRGGRAARGGPRGLTWEARQRHAHPDPARAARQIRDDLERGATAIELVVGAGALDCRTAADFAALLDGLPAGTPVALDAGADGPAAAALLVAALGSATGALHLGLDPLGALAGTGRLPGSLDRAWDATAAWCVRADAAPPGSTVLRLDGARHQQAGASPAQALTAMLSGGVAALRALDARGVAPVDAAPLIVLRLATDADIFPSIALLRAARRLWARVLEACGVPAAGRGARLEAITLPTMLARHDAYTNLLRTTAAAFAAVAGGADVVTVEPFDAAVGVPGDVARRLARNTHLLLAEEAGLGRVMDPAGGAWSIERLTDALVAAGWALFQEVEAEGGLPDALARGVWQERLAATRATREAAIATGAAAIVGVSAWPALDTALPETEAVPAPALPDAGAPAELHGATAGRGLAEAMVAAAAGGATVASLSAALGGAPDSVVPLPLWRPSAPFEALRDAADAAAARPRVLVVALGPESEHAPRVAFARNLIAAGGIETVVGPPDAAGETGTEVAALCGSDAAYAADGPAAIAALRAAGVAVYVAGRPGTPGTEGADDHMHLKSDRLALLRGLHARLGVTP